MTLNHIWARVATSLGFRDAGHAQTVGRQLLILDEELSPEQSRQVFEQAAQDVAQKTPPPARD